TGPGLEGHILELIGCRKVLDLKYDLVSCLSAFAWEQVVDTPPDHVVDQAVMGVLTNWFGGDVSTISEHCDGISDLKYLVELVADIEHCDADARETADHVKQQRNLRRR